MVDLSIVMFVIVYQRVNLHFPMVFLWFSYGFPMVFLWFYDWVRQFFNVFRGYKPLMTGMIPLTSGTGIRVMILHTAAPVAASYNCDL